MMGGAGGGGERWDAAQTNPHRGLGISTWLGARPVPVSPAALSDAIGQHLNRTGGWGRALRRSGAV